MDKYLSCLVNEEYEIVWKYGFATQDFEMGHTYKNFAIG